MSDALLRLDGVWKRFEAQEVLRGLDLAVTKGETLTLLGGSGTGKSVTLKLMIGLLRPDRGRVRFRDRDLTELRERDWIEVRRH
jgi:phospholipid/cholesterol/gamma-HCH transport system ATP-binding protein